MSSETLQAGDWVRADTGEIGHVIHTTRQSAFVQLVDDAPDATIRAYLLSQLTKIDPPDDKIPGDGH